MTSVSDLTVERRRAPLGIDAVRPRFAWRLDGESSQSAYQLEVLDVWDSQRVASSQSTYVVYGGPPLESRRRYQWRVRAWTQDGGASDWSAPSAFEVGLLGPDDWSARWIAPTRSDLISEPEELPGARPVAVLRRTFTVGSVPQRGRLYITALGLYDAFINGQRVGEEWLTPGWTDYTKRLQYQTYDVTGLVRGGENELSVRLGDGWYCGTVGAHGTRRYGDFPALLCQLEVDDVVIATDANWQTQPTGTGLNDIQLGERTDLRAAPGETWSAVSNRAAPGVQLVAGRDDGIRVVDVLQPASSSGSIFDFGANAAGVLRLRVRGARDQQVVIRHAEAVEADGSLHTRNLRTAEARDEFILADSESVVLEPRFTFHGFQFAEVTGATVEQAEYEVLSSATRQVGAFSCSNPLVNKLQSNIWTSLRANFISIPTDCPQRNERLGWTADLQIFAPTALFVADVGNMLDKWLDDLVDAQLASGAYPDVAPVPPGFAGWGTTGWGDAGVIVPWVLYERTGDAGVLERMYPSMQRFMGYLESDLTDGLRFAGRYGDWVSLGARTDKTLLGTAYVAYVADLFARIASVVGRDDDRARFAALSDSVRRAFQRRFVSGAGHLTAETQTSYALALSFGLIPEDDRSAAGNRLAELVRAEGTHLATGFLGTPIVMPALSDTGHHELACELLQQETYPSWLFEVRNGATSIWERWNGWTPEQGFHPSRMNSFNHYAFGAVGDWMYRYLAGLEPIEPGYRRVRFQPRPGAGFTAASATHESLYGVHACSWQLEGGRLAIDVQVPGNTTATLVLPTGSVEVAPGRHHVETSFKAHVQV